MYARLFLVILSLSVGATGVHAENVASFSFEPLSQWDVPLPSDVFTMTNPSMLTGRRMNLPLPVDTSQISEQRDIESVSVLDGFSIFPRITVPLSGAVPDMQTFTSENVYLVGLSPAKERGKVIAIDQRILDDAVVGNPRLIFAPDEYLSEQSRYAIVISKRLTGAAIPFQSNATFQKLIDRYLRGSLSTGYYEDQLRDTLDVITDSGIESTDTIASLSVFTTRTVTDIPVKLLQRISSGEFPIMPARFNVDGQPGLEFIPAQNIVSIDSFAHRASKFADGTNRIDFPAGTLRVELSGGGFSADAANEIYIKNIRNGLRVLVPRETIDTTTGAIIRVNIADIRARRDDELAVLVRLKRFSSANPPLQWDKIGHVAFGSIDAPQYTNEQGVIPFVVTGAEGIPQETGVESVVFSLFLPGPSAPPPAPGTTGWPVVHLLHGGAETKSSFVSGETIQTAPMLASRGLATATFVAKEFEGGPRSFLEVGTTSGIRTIPNIGRAFDVEGDGLYQATEIYVYPQRISDLAVLLRALQMGVDLNKDGVNDIARGTNRTYVAGISFGGAAAFIAAALEPKASVFVSNVPTSEGSRARASGFHPLVAERGRTFAEDNLAARQPSLLNGPSPRWGGEFNEDIPLKEQPVQVGMVPGAEAIQRALDFNMWRDLESMPIAYAKHVGSGELRGAPATLLIQVARGDGAAVNPIQAQMIRSGKLKNKTAMIQLDNVPKFDKQWGRILPPELARHVLIALPYVPQSPLLETASAVCQMTRLQLADYFQSQGSTVTDPDGAGKVFAGDVFQFPISDQLLDEMIIDPGLPPLQ